MSHLDLTQSQHDGATPTLATPGRRPPPGKEPIRSGSIIFESPITASGLAQYPPQPEGAALPFGASTLHHAEPRMFPGVVSRRRESSITRLSNTAGPPSADGENEMKSSAAGVKKDGIGLQIGTAPERELTIEEAATEDSEGDP